MGKIRDVIVSNIRLYQKLYYENEAKKVMEINI